MTRDTYREDGPSPAVAERADDAQYAGDFATMVAIFRTELAERDGLGSVLVWLHNVGECGPDLSTDQFLDDFIVRWGIAKALRALATAIEQPEQVLVDTVEHP